MHIHTHIAQPDCCKKRCRKSWRQLSDFDRDLYIEGWKKLADTGEIQKMSKTHGDLFWNGIHYSEMFLPWHRAFLQDFEDKVRALGGKWACFALPYWFVIYRFASIKIYSLRDFWNIPLSQTVDLMCTRFCVSSNINLCIGTNYLSM